MGRTLRRRSLGLFVQSEERRFEIEVGEGAWIHVRMRRDPEKGLDWAAVLRVKRDRDGALIPICVYDNAHGAPERHRIRGGIKLRAESRPSRGSANLDMPAAIDEIKADWEGTVERWL